jgi:hypothetical protein
MAHCHAAAFAGGTFKLPPQLLAPAQVAWREHKEAPVVSQLQRTVYHVFKPYVKVGRPARRVPSFTPSG